MNNKERIIIFLLAAINFTHILDFMIMMPLGNYLMPYMNISPRQFSFLVGAYPITAFCSGFTAAFFVDRHDRKKILAWAYAGFLAGTLACGFADTYPLLLGARIFTGLFGGLIGAQVFSIIADLFPYERRGVAMGAAMSAFAIASIFGVPFSLYLANLFTWHAPFLFVGLLGIFVLIPVTRFIPSMKGHMVEGRKNPFQAFQNLLDSRHQRMALMFSCILMMGHFLIIPFINPYLEFNIGFTKEQTPLFYLSGGIASFFAAIFLGKLADRVGKFRVFSYSVLFSFIMVWIITNLPMMPFAVVIILLTLWFIVATGRAVTAQAMLSNVVPPEQRGSFMSFNSSFQQLGTALASFISGYIVIKEPNGKLAHYDWVGYLSIAVLLISLVLGKMNFGAENKLAYQRKSTD